MFKPTTLNGPWTPPVLPATIKHGDMPGDKILIERQHIEKATTLFPPLCSELSKLLLSHPHHRAVVGISGGSGVGKSEIASVLGAYLKAQGIGAYILSGDNYPHRIPRENDMERLRVYRTGGLKALLMSGCYLDEYGKKLREFWAMEQDAEPGMAKTFPWMHIYQQGAERSLDSYLGSPAEIDFDEVNGIISAFKNGTNMIALKRMGREVEELFYNLVNFTDIQVLIIEWTHAGSDYLRGIDVPILLHSTPKETLAHRLARARDSKPDSPFTTAVLRLEQIKLVHQAHHAKLILSKGNQILTYEQYQMLTMEYRNVLS